MENPQNKWRFLAGNIIYFYGLFSMAMLNNQRVVLEPTWWPLLTGWDVKNAQQKMTWPKKGSDFSGSSNAQQAWVAVLQTAMRKWQYDCFFQQYGQLSDSILIVIRMIYRNFTKNPIFSGEKNHGFAHVSERFFPSQSHCFWSNRPADLPTCQGSHCMQDAAQWQRGSGPNHRGGWYQEDHPVNPLPRWQFAKWMAIEFVAQNR